MTALTQPPATSTAPTVGSTRRARKRTRTRSPLLTVLVLLTLPYFLLPLFWLVVSSTKTNGELFSTFGLWFSHIHLWSNVVDVFTAQDGTFWTWSGNTVLYATVSAVGASALATAAGYAFAKYDFPGGKALFSIVLGSIMVPTTALAIPTYLVFAQVNLTDTRWAVILPSLVSPFGVYLMRVYAADTIDSQLLEAARVDGASEMRIFFSVALRLLVPGSVTVLLFTLVATWNNYFLPLIMLRSNDLLPLTVGLAQWQTAASGQSGAQALFSRVITGSFISVVPLMAAFLYLQKYWQSGLTSGGVKG
ncbi:carbohydrate ABC transporter permease [Streptomyces sp. SID13726]|uniref:carbohydrate ABC transporter permease n=1 Tax=Streptomyces sp. SID13726 TaxID=2706058 RepID=UPI0013B992F2|nr:carbohydrate ABC transporter permease [Streptomyces sp. SID13726]NEB03477.1 carbohydrate ABC transporter permease [Streptomyces sp. SID13726]